jgi:hypothetical protein
MEIQTNTSVVTNLNTNGQAAGASKKQSKADMNEQAAELSSDFGKIQERALQLADDSAAIQAARNALKNGDLDTEAVFLSAAETLLTLGL